MTTKEVAEDLVALCRQGQFSEAVSKYYSNDIVSVEANPEVPDMKGLDAVVAKGKQFYETTEVHSMEVSEPQVVGDHFSVGFSMDCTNRQAGMRMTMNEIGVYQVKDGKIVHEHFHYALG